MRWKKYGSGHDCDTGVKRFGSCHIVEDEMVAGKRATVRNQRAGLLATSHRHAGRIAQGSGTRSSAVPDDGVEGNSLHALQSSHGHKIR